MVYPAIVAIAMEVKYRGYDETPENHIAETLTEIEGVEHIGTYESTGTIDVYFKTGEFSMFGHYEIPEGYEFDAATYNDEQERMSVALTPTE